MAIPPVVAVVVAHDPGEWFTETLQSLADQTYPDLSVLVVDAGSQYELGDRVAAVLPDAYLQRLEDNPGYGAATNQVLASVEGASFYVLLHDDVALEPDAIRTLVEEAFRSNAGIAGPKLVDWDHPDQLLQVGMNVDKTGVLSPVAERGELDQEQHDAVRDVFVVPTACMLVRADLFTHVGGFDDGIDFLGDDLDLCWRSHVAGARVVIVPQARVRHREALDHRGIDVERDERLARHRVRSMLSGYSGWTRVRVVPQALLLTVVGAIYALVTGRGPHARALWRSWTWNLRRRGDVRAKRAAVKRIRQVSDHEVRELQAGGFVQLSAFLRGQRGGDADEPAPTRLRRRIEPVPLTLALVLVALLIIGSRELIFGDLPAIGEMARFPSSPFTMLRDWASGWRTAGLGSDAYQPTGFGVIGLLGTVFLGAMGVLRKVLILGMLPLGAYGAWRLARPIGSRRADVVALAVYVAIPVPYNALVRGSWSGLLLYGAAPWMLLSLARASQLAPYGSRLASDDVAGVRLDRRFWGQVLGLGFLLALVGAIVPFVLAVAIGMALALAVGSILVFRAAGVPRLVAAAVGASVVGVVLHLPWSLDLLRPAAGWESFAGIRTSTAGSLSLPELLRFETGPYGAPPLGWAFLLAAGLPLIIGRSWRLEWAARAWAVALAGWAALWAGESGWLPVGLPAPEIVLAPVAAALALSAAMGMAAFEIDLRAYRFGWRQALAVLAGVGIVAAALPLLGGLVDGRWKVPDSDFNQPLDQLFAQSPPGSFRVLWLGDPEVLPLAGWQLDDGLAYATSNGGTPDVRNLWSGSDDQATSNLRQMLDVALDGDTTRLGRLLAPMGVQYVVVPSQLAPDPDAGEVAPPPPQLRAALASQLDLEEVPVIGGITIYRNDAWVAGRAVLPSSGARRARPEDAVAEDLSKSPAALLADDGPTNATGAVPRAGDLLVSQGASDKWKVSVAGRSVPRSTVYGWANQFDVGQAGKGSLTYETPITRRLLLLGQIALWLVALVAWRRTRGVRRREVGS